MSLTVLSTSEWKRSLHVAPNEYTPDDETVIELIEALLMGNPSPAEAATQIAATYEARIKTVPSGGGPGKLWTIFPDAARYFGASRQHAAELADLVINISRAPDVVDSRGEPVGGRWQRQLVYWRGLPEFAMWFREYGLYLEGPDNDEEDYTEWEPQACHFTNATTVAASLLSRSEHDYGCVFWAAIALKNGLEDPRVPDNKAWSKVYLSAASIWIIIGGRKLYQYCSGNILPNTTGTGCGRLWHGSKDLTLERWSFWKSRLQELATVVDLDDGYRGLVAEAASCIETISR